MSLKTKDIVDWVHANAPLLRLVSFLLMVIVNISVFFAKNELSMIHKKIDRIDVAIVEDKKTVNRIFGQVEHRVSRLETIIDRKNPQRALDSVKENRDGKNQGVCDENCELVKNERGGDLRDCASCP
jgi:hypothetical protein